MAKDKTDNTPEILRAECLGQTAAAVQIASVGRARASYFRFATGCPQRRERPASPLGLFCALVDSLPGGA